MVVLTLFIDGQMSSFANKQMLIEWLCEAFHDEHGNAIL